MHLTDHLLHAYSDRELAEGERAAAADHLAACPDCRSRLAEAEARAAQVRARLTALAPAPAEAPRPAPAALARLIERQTAAPGKDIFVMLKRIFSPRFRPLWIGVSAVAALAIAFNFAPVRAWAGEFLGLFRVKQVAVLPIDSTRLSDLTGNSSLSKQIGQLVSDSATIIKKPAEPRVVAGAAEASQIAGFTVRLPANQTAAPQLTVQDGVAFQFVVDRSRAQALLNEAGRSDLQLPASLDGATIKVEIPAGVTAAYGTCPQPKEGDDEIAVTRAPDGDVTMKGSVGRRYADCVMLAEIPSPTVTTPPDLDVAQLAELGLQFTGMTAEQAHTFSQTVDWASTLVVPIPRNGATHKQVAVDGVTGYLIQRPADDAPEYALIWVKNGVIYAIGGLGTNSDQALAMANSME